MTELFGIDAAQIFLDTLGDIVLDATLTVVTIGTRTPGALTSGTQPSSATKTAKGYIEDYDNDQIDETIVAKGDRKVVLLAGSIQDNAVPKNGDTITIEGVTFTIMDVGRDSLQAIYICQGRTA